MTSNFDSATIKFPCPKCSYQFHERARQLMYNAHLTCPACGSSLQIEEKALRDGLKSVEASGDDFNR